MISVQIHCWLLVGRRMKNLCLYTTRGPTRKHRRRSYTEEARTRNEKRQREERERLFSTTVPQGRKEEEKESERGRVFNSFLHAAATGCRSHTRIVLWRCTCNPREPTSARNVPKIVWPVPVALVLEPVKKLTGLMARPSLIYFAERSSDAGARSRELVAATAREFSCIYCL